MMASDWKELTLDAVCSRITDGAHSSPRSVPEGKPMASVKDLTPFGIRLESCRRIPIEDFEKLVRQGCQPVKGDVLIAKDGATALDTVCEVKRNEDVVLLSSVAILRPNPAIISSSYLHYYLDSSTTRSYLKGTFVGGSAIPRVVLKDLKRAAVHVPPLPIQRRIASIMSAYDELIENSQRRIKILETMARTLYREWFVYFRFPGHESVSRVPSPLGDIPHGWTVWKLREVTTKIGSGATPRGGKDAYKTEGIPLIRSLNIYDYSFQFDDLAFIDKHQAAGLDNVIVQEADILLNITGASVARCALAPSHLLPARVNQHVAIVRADPAKASPFYVLDAINSDNRKSQLLALAQGGATREALTKDTIANFEILGPPRPLMEYYNSVASGIHRQREVLLRQTQTLRRTRDLLLPRLLSGQINVEAIAA